MTFVRKTIATICCSMIAFSSAIAVEMEELKSRLAAEVAKVQPQFKIESIKKSKMPGVYKVQITDGGPLLYMEEGGKYFFTGTLYEIQKSSGVANLTELDKTAGRKSLVKTFKPEEMIVFTPKAPVKVKSVINVFTDVDCYYCQKLHQEVPEMNALGIEVRYLAYPRAGEGSATYKKLVSAWCSDDPQDAITRLKSKQTIPNKTCENPVSQQFALGKRLGVTGTPAIILEDGQLIPGYKPAKAMASQLGI